jgi:hypothetical protein
MATVTATSMGGTGQRTLTYVTLTGTADTFTYNASRAPVLVLFNDTGGSLSPIIDGAGASAALPVKGVGVVDLTAGYPVGSIGAGVTKAIPLDSIAQYLKGAIAITSGTGLSAALMEF